MAFLHSRWNSSGSPSALEPVELEYSVRKDVNKDPAICLCQIANKQS